MRLLSLTPLGEVVEGECSSRQLAMASEGRCPGCESDEVERVSGIVGGWQLGSEWGSCSSCGWAHAFTVFVPLGSPNPVLARLSDLSYHQTAFTLMGDR